MSPDRTKVLLERTHEEESAACGLPACAEIFVVDAGGGAERPLTAKDEDTVTATWSPDGERIAFSKRDLKREGDASPTFRPTSTSSIRTGATRNGSPISRVKKASPTWSPDGKQIAFSTSTGEEGDIYVMNSDGTELTRLTDLPGVEIEPVWSPDGERNAFSTEWVDRADVYVMNSDGSELRRLTDPAEGESSPAWSPDGDMLAYARGSDELAKIVIANDDDSDQREVVPPSGDQLSVGAPVWSPDGKQLAFTDQSAIWVVDSDARNVRDLWSRPLSQPFVLHWAAED
jgi:TolB protein